MYIVEHTSVLSVKEDVKQRERAGGLAGAVKGRILNRATTRCQP